MDIGFVAKIVTVIIKSVANSKIGSELGKELMGTSIDGVSEKSITEINNFIKGKKSKIEHILSKENMKAMDIAEENVDFVVHEIKDLLSDVEISDNVLRECRYSHEDLKDFLWNEYCKNKNNIENESDIKKGLDTVAKVLIELMRESDNFEEEVLIHISNTVDDIQLGTKDDFSNMMKKFDRLEESNEAILSKVSENISVSNRDKVQRKMESRTKEYFKKWNKNMFLNDFDKRDRNAGANVKLSEVYLDKHLPHYIWGKNDEEESSTDLKKLLSEYINEKRDSKMLLIMGQPGIGKSTLITWITANFWDKANDILVYKFASDLVDTDWSNAGLLYRILEKLGFEYSELNRKILILDGLDEVSIANRREVLDALYDDLIYGNHIENFSLIITCRENYIERIELLKCKYITLQPWDEAQIRSFSCIFQKKAKSQICKFTIEKAIEIQDIFGIPLILYMVLALNISIEKEASIVDVYDKIFSLEGGIYDRCIDNKKFAGSHRIGEVKKQIHQISREIAIWMFENNPVDAYIPQEEYKKICANVMQESKQKNEDIQHDFLIGNYFKLVRHCEGVETEKLYFVHRSIYEYFVAETIYYSIEKAITKLTDASQEELAGNIAIYLKQGLITNTIGEYLGFKLLKLYNNLDAYKKDNFYQCWENTVGKMMDKGMFYYTGSNIRDYDAIIDKETQCFYNLLKILKLLQKTNKRKYILEDADKNQLEKYIRFRLVMCRMEERHGTERFNLSKIFLEGINLSGVDFTYTNLNDANLKNANLSSANFEGMCILRANFYGANLSNANLRCVNLIEVDLREINLKDAKLVGSLIGENQIKYLEEKCDLRGVCIKIIEENKIVDYEEYCNEYR